MEALYTVLIIVVSSLLTVYFQSKIRSLPRTTFRLVGVFSLIVSYIIIISVASTRTIDIGIGGTDAIHYKNYFLNANGDLISSLKSQGYEYGYGFIVWLFRLFTDKYHYFLIFIYSVMFYSLVYILNNIKVKNNQFLYVALFVIMLFNSFNTTRVILSIFITLIMVIKLNKKKYSTSVVLALISLSIHITGIISFMFIISTIFTRKYRSHNLLKTLSFISMLAIGLFAFILVLDVIYIQNSKYVIYRDNVAISWGTYIIIIIFTVLSYKKYNEMVKFNNLNKTLIAILPYGLIFIFSQSKFSIFYRFTIYYVPIIIALIPSLLAVYNYKKVLGFIAYITSLGYLIIRFSSFYTEEIQHIKLNNKVVSIIKFDFQQKNSEFYKVSKDSIEYIYKIL